MIEFGWPWAAALLPLPILARLLLRPVGTTQTALTVPTVDAFVFEERGAGLDAPKRRIVLLLLCLAWSLLVAAATRPQWTGDPVRLPTSGRDLMLAVDISGSMSTEDMELDGERVNRLVVVKAVVRDFIERRHGDRVGLILFGTNAYLQAPLTFDLKTIRQLLIEAPVGIAGGKTAIGDAIGLAVKRLRTRPRSSRVLVLLTDGANNVGEVAPRKAAELANTQEIRVHTIGVGDDQMRVPSLFGTRIVNPSADLDEATLMDVAKITGGRYFRARNTAELAGIYELINELEPVEQEAETFRPIRALYHWPLAASLALFCLLVWSSRRG